MFEGFDFADFWNNCDWTKKYVGNDLTKQDVDMVESELGYRLPPSYIELMKIQNGGVPQKNFYLVPDKNHSAVYLNTIFGLDSTKEYSLCGGLGSKFRIDEWGYPSYGIYFGDTLSGGHELFLMDYRVCGKDGEPEILLIDQECDYRITFVAKDFETFIRGLLYEEDMPEDRL